jgi:hypothetical protein
VILKVVDRFRSGNEFDDIARVAEPTTLAE